MKLISLQLNNIRSYKSEKISFPDGVVLLAGDIGCGKSTILQAIEFALFGMRRGFGLALLRHGSNEGEVQLRFKIDSQEVLITRTLKRTNTGVSQDAGYLLIDGQKIDATAVELKSKILTLLNYPDNLLTKSKELIYRYTVYTPQEDMKAILFEKPEERLNTLRKLFSVDKYKLIRENATLYSRELKNSIERLKGHADDLPNLNEELKLIQDKIIDHSKKVVEAELVIKQEEPKVLALKEELALIEKNKFEYEQLKSAHAIAKNRFEQYVKEEIQIMNELSELKEKIKDDFPSKEEIVTKKIELNNRLKLQKTEEETIRNNILLNQKNLAKIEHIIDESNDRIKNIASLEKCPTCLQDVTEEHKDHVKQSSIEKQEKIKKKEILIKTKISELNNKLETQQNLIQNIQKEISDLSVLGAKVDAHEERKRLLNNKEKRLKLLQKDKFDLEISLKEKTHELETKKPIDNYLEKKNILSSLERNYNELKINLARLEQESKSQEKNSERIVNSIKEKMASLKRSEELQKKHTWLTKHFSNLMFTIEKHVLMNVYHQFNDAFREWFDTLIEENTLTVRLDESFSPVIVQNGYEAFVENLSGGEKTSVALAYRLALNKVMNQLQDLKTQDLLILDEPTDGFSSEQLDRVKEVISNLHLKQVIIVSHEQKMESFVDHIIRIVKHDHESHVL